MADLDPTQPRVPHPGVDARSWLGFEQRIQAKRFDALLASAREAIAAGNLPLATHALEEARELRPHAPEAMALADEITRVTPPADGPATWRRAGRGVMLLAAGVLMVVALDQTRLLPGAIPMLAPPPPQFLEAAPVMRTLDPIPEYVRIADSSERDRGDDSGVAAAASADARKGRDRDRRDALPVRNARTQVAGTETEPTDGAPPASAPDLPALATEKDEAPAAVGPSDHQSGDSVDAAIVLPIGTSSRHSAAADIADRVDRSLRAPVAAAPALAAVADAADSSGADRVGVEDVLRRYARAYGELDVRAARDVWPSVDQRALSRAFNSLSSQTVSFDACDIDVQGATANASCRGSASYVGKVGSGAPRIEPRTWRFELRRDGTSWKIATAEARRTSG